MYYGNLRTTSHAPQQGSRKSDYALKTKIQALTRRVNRLELVNQVLWELIRDSTSMTDDDLEKRINEIDLRDGVADKKVSVVPLRCPTCKRVSSSKHWKCLYCGQQFERGSY